MSKHLQLSILTPCHENWDNMPPVEKGRFCGSCQKKVIDFSNMSDREIAIFFKKPSGGSVCGRFMQDQLDRDIQIPKKRIPWVKYFFQFALPAFLMSAKATAQGKVVQKNKMEEKSACTQTPDMIAPGIRVEKKKVIDDTAMVSVKKIFNDTIVLPEIVLVLYQQITTGKVAMGLSVSQIPAKDTNTEATQTCTIRLGGAIAYRRPKVKSDSLFQNIRKIFFKDTAFKNFEIYPNPAVAGSTITIEWNKAEAGDYDFHLFNQSGQLQMKQEIRSDEDMKFVKINLPATISAGIYFLRVTDRKKGKSYTEKIIVQ